MRYSFIRLAFCALLAVAWPGLAQGAGDDGEVIAQFAEMPGQQADQAREDDAVAELLFDGEQADFEHAAARGQIGIEAGEFIVK